MSEASRTDRQSVPPGGGSDRGFWIGLAILGGSYVFLILAMLLADVFSRRRSIWPNHSAKSRSATPSN
jgi:hypothetical protein